MIRPPVRLLVLACALLVLVPSSVSAAPSAPPPSPPPVPPPGTPAPTSGAEDPASSAGRPVDPHPDVEDFFTPPPTEMPPGTLRHTPYELPDWARFFDPEADPEWQFTPAPAPDLFVAEPEYGGVDAGMVRVASAILGRSAPWEMTRKEARGLVRRAADEAAVLTTITRTDFDPEGILQASRRLGQPATSLWEVDVDTLAGAATSSLRQALATWDVEVGNAHRVGSVTRAVRRAQRRAGLSDRVNGRNLARLSTRTGLARADGASHGGVTIDLGPAIDVASLLQRRTLTARLPDGAVARGHVLMWHPDDPGIELTTDLTGGWGRRASVHDAAARLGAVAAVNGGFWLDDSEPDGLLVTDGRMRSDATAWTGTQRGVRGALGVTRDDEVIVDKPDWQIRLQRGEHVVGIDALNRPARPGQTVAWNNDGPLPSGSARSWWRVPDVGQRGRAVRLPGPAVPGPHDLVVATDRDLSGRWRTSIAATEGWDALEDGLAAGPRLLFDGRRTPPGWWIGEGFATPHTHRRHPRTAVGVDPFGSLITFVIDGRQPGWSAGATQAETQSIAQALGLKDATMLDGGGSTQMVVKGRVTNRPCCDTGERPVATVAAFVRR